MKVRFFSFVAFDVPLELLTPKLSVGLRKLESAFGTAVPETSHYENGDSSRDERNVWTPGYPRRMETVAPPTELPQSPAKGQFR